MSDDGLPPLRTVIANYGLSARKSLGQNFLLDLNLTGRIARACGPLDGVTVVEVGPGPGGLTRALLAEGAGHVIAIERDDRCLPALSDISDHYPNRLTIVSGDALAVDYDALLAGHRSVQLAANLPYNISTAMLTRWLEIGPWPPWFSRMTLMFQREVADRIVSVPGNKIYGRLSVLAQWRTEARVLFKVPPRAFTPAPKVESAIVSFVPKEKPAPECDLTVLLKVTKAAFGQRRKMLRSSLKQITSDAEFLLDRAGLAPDARAEDLTVEAFCRLANALSDVRA